jgi:2-dehydro-3-deoxygluconokinase
MSETLTIKSSDETSWDLLSLGEVMLRFDPGEERISRARNFRVWEGGGEYNVARGLRRCFGMRASVVTALVDNPVGRLIEDLMLQGGVDLSHVRWEPHDGLGHDARNGIYFLEKGFGIRGAVGMMDRGHTPLSQLRAGQIDWNEIFGGEGVRWFHTGGIMAALSDHAPALIEEAMAAAHRHGAVVSFDCNYRPSLWKQRGGRSAAIEVNRRLLQYVDVLFGHHGDVAKDLGLASHSLPWHDEASYGESCGQVVEEFPELQVIATTNRHVKNASVNDWGGFAYQRGQVLSSAIYRDLAILDRVGGGDSFAAGLIFGLLQGKHLGWALECGVAHGALTMTTPGDNSMAALPEVLALMSGASAKVQR